MSDAAQRRGNTLDDLLTCAVCLDGLTDPRTLTCLHTFCTACLEGCRRALRRDIECPVCKRVTTLSSLGVTGLPIDYRVQQIRDVIKSQSENTARVAAMEGAEVVGARMSTEVKAVEGSGALQICDMCKANSARTTQPPPASAHCIQCFMWFCTTCLTKHGATALFAAHDVLRLDDSGEGTERGDTVFCITHRGHAVRYFCRSCQELLCTICAMYHDSSHSAEPLDRDVIDRYRGDLKRNCVTVQGILAEVATRVKCIETLRQSEQGSLYRIQSLIRERTDHLIGRLREQERHLLSDAMARFDTRMSEFGVDRLGELSFFRIRLETLLQDISDVLHQSPHKCVIAYTDLSARFKTVSETVLPPIGARHRSGASTTKAIKFIPSSDSLDFVIGNLQECNINPDEDTGSLSDSVGGRTPEIGEGGEGGAHLSPAFNPLRKRTASILSALSPSRKDLKIGRMKDINRWIAGGTSGSPDQAGSVTMGLSCAPMQPCSSSSPLTSSPVIRRLDSHFQMQSSAATGGQDLLAIGRAAKKIKSETTFCDAAPFLSTGNPVTSVPKSINSPTQTQPVMFSYPMTSSTSSTPDYSVAARTAVKPDRHVMVRALSTESSATASCMTPVQSAAVAIADTTNISTNTSSLAPSISGAHDIASISSSSSTSSSSSYSLLSSPTFSYPPRSGAEASRRSGGLGGGGAVSPHSGAESCLRSGRSGGGGAVSPSQLFIQSHCTDVAQTSPSSQLILVPRLLFQVNQTGGMPGSLTAPSGVALLSNGSVVVAETDQRLQVFDITGQSKRVIGWGRIKPQCVVVTSEGHVACTDKKDRTVKQFMEDGLAISAWDAECSFGVPSGLALMSNGQFVVTDVERKCVTVHTPTGRVVSRIGSWGDGAYLFTNPAYVTVDRLTDNIYVSDPVQASIKVFDRTGVFIRRFSLPMSYRTANKSSQLMHSRPGGLCADRNGNIAVCDVDNHKVSLFTGEGTFIGHIVTEAQGIQYPCDVEISSDGCTLAVIESHTGFLTNNPHHAVKLFRLD